ncbi:uncharacterized protein LOC126897445 [Daktulosphaira vitifoliae]|uniref:uncharacterized protein LOC126897445 n=1 Tax=Daktulosphaira vitifoliae TaxID=58002 RepID=UPI0021AAB795|nr:uncharacterized protein LOC126897445 [Daktulosphaira vitifoliae]
MKSNPVTFKLPTAINYNTSCEITTPTECDSFVLENGRVPLPILDDNDAPGSILVMFVEAQVYSMSWSGDQLLSRYYVQAMRCMSNSVEFQNNFENWLNEVVKPLLEKKQWYPVFGGVLRVIESLKLTNAGRRSKRVAPEISKLAWLDYNRYYALERPPIPEPPNFTEGPACETDTILIANSNVFLLVILVSLMMAWISFGYLKVHGYTRWLLKSLKM